MFPYYQNYLDLTKLEYFSIMGCTKHLVHNYLFIGGGPLPMTAIILAMIYKVKVTILDYDGEACEISKKLIEILRLDYLIEIINTDGSKFEGYNNFDVVFVAALAGTNKRIKTKILSRIKEMSKENTHVLARSSWGNRQLLYSPLGKEIYKTFYPVIEVHPQNHIVNSVVIMRT